VQTLGPAPPLDKRIIWGYFDGANQGNPSGCGAGAILYIIECHFFSKMLLFG
jgi:hypothetical protein